MKTIILAVLAGIMLTAFSPIDDTTLRSERVTELSGYKLRDQVIDFHDFNIWVATTEDVFDRTFVAENHLSARPNFGEQMVLGVKVETLSFNYAVKFRTMRMDKNTLNVYFGVRKAGPAQNGEGPVSLAVVPKSGDIRKINFYHDNILVKSVPIVAVY